MPVALDGGPVVTGLITLQELGRKVVDQFRDLLGLPLILTLVIVDRVLCAAQEHADVFGFTSDFLHLAISLNISSISFLIA